MDLKVQCPQGMVLCLKKMSPAGLWHSAVGGLRTLILPSKKESKADPSLLPPAQEETHAERKARLDVLALKNPLPDYVLTEKEEKRERIYRFCAKWLFRIIYRPKFVGFENIPDEGPAILIANHVSYVDGTLINACYGKRPVRYIIDKLIYEVPGVNHFMRINRAIPIYPKKEIVEASFEAVKEGMERGDLICIFPEGQLTYTGNLGRFKLGIEHIINDSPVPVIPIGIEGLWGSIASRKYLRAKWRFIPRGLPRVRLVCGEPIMPEQVKVNYLQRRIMELMREAREL